MYRALKTDPINQLEENLECTVCLEPLNDPRTLPCFHSFCKDCLEGVVKTCRDKAPRGRPIREFPCPNCRETFTLDPDKQVADMRMNHFICNMVKATAVLDRGTGVPCSHNCSQSYSVARCVTCEKFLCRECLTDHNKYRGHNAHSVLTMEELSKPENRKKIKDKMYCNEHQGKTLKVYCETCDQLVCKDCMYFKHLKQNHSCFLVKDVANNYKELLASNNNAMDDVLTEGNAFAERLTLTTEGLGRDAEDAKSKIIKRKEFMAKKVIKMLDQKAETLLNEVDQIHKGELTKLDKQNRETKLYVEHVQRSVELLKKLVDQGTEEEIISSQKMMLESANNLLTKRQEYFKTPISVAKFNYTPLNEPLNEEVLKGLANSLGEVNGWKEEKGAPAVTEMQTDFEKSEKNRYDRTILVSGLPERVTENSVHIHFQKKKNGGGYIEKVTLLAEGKAMVVFEDPKVAKVVVNTEQIFKGNVLEVKHLGTETLKENMEKLARTIWVSGLPEGATENSVHIHFQKKKNAGGELEKVEMLGDGKAIVVFEEPEVAMNVVATQQTIKGKVVHVELMETEARANAETPGKPGISEQESATVYVSGLPEGTTENGVHIHFQKKTNGGGEIKRVELLLPGKKKAIVIFEDLEVAKRVVSTEQILKGKRLHVNLQGTETKPNIGNSETEDGVEKPRTIVVSDLPEGATDNGIHIHFQKKKNGGGEIEKVVLLPGNTALVVFEDSEVARRVVTTPQQMKGKSLTITSTFLNKENSPEVTTSEVKATPEAKPKLEVKANPDSKMEPEINPVFSRMSATVNPTLKNLNQSGTTFNQMGTTFNQSGRPESRQNPKYSLHHQQPEWIGEGQWPNEPDRNRDNSYARKLGNARYNQYPHSDREMGYFKNHQQFRYPPNTHTQYLARSPSAGETDTLRTKPGSAVHKTRNPQPLKNGQNIKGTDTTAGKGNTTPNVDGTSLHGTTDEYPARSPNSTITHQPLFNNQKSTTPNLSTERGRPTTNNKFPSPSNEKEVFPNEKSPTSTKGTTNYQLPVRNQQSLTPNSTTGPEISTTSSNQFASPSTGNHNSVSTKPPVSPDCSTNPQQTGNVQQVTMVDPTTGTQNSTNSNNKVGSPSNDQPDSRLEKSLPDNATTPQSPSNDQQGMTTGPQSSTTSNSGAPLSGNSESRIKKPPSTSDCTTNPPPPNNDQKDPSSGTTTEPQNSTTSNSGALPNDRPEPLTARPSTPTENTPNNQQQHNQQQHNQQQHNQQQTTPDQNSNQQTSTPENTNTETSPVSEPGVNPRASTETNPNSTNKPQKRTPVSLPRRNNAGTNERRQNSLRRNRAFPRQQNPLTTDCVTGTPTAATKANTEIDQGGMTQNSQNLIKTDVDNREFKIYDAAIR